MDTELEPSQIGLLKVLVNANHDLDPDERQPIIGMAADGKVTYFHPGFPKNQLVPNPYDLDCLQSAGMISAIDQGGRKGWKIEVLPYGKTYLKELDLTEAAIISNPSLERLHNAPSVDQPAETSPADPKSEALDLLIQVLIYIERGNPDLKRTLRMCATAALLLRQQEAVDIFNKDVRGYFENESPLYYRNVVGHIIWRSIGSSTLNDPTDTAAVLASKQYGNPPCTLPLRTGLSRIQDLAVLGHTQMSQAIKSVAMPDGKSLTGTWVEAIEVYPPEAFKTCLQNMEQAIWEWSTYWIVFLRFENRIGDIWERYRSSVDSTLAQIGLAGHFQALDTRLASANEQDWRSVLYSCRDLLHDIANHLWLDERSFYQHSKLTDGKNQPIKLQVTQDRYINRIRAYLHQKTLKASEVGLMETEAEFLGELFGRLNHLDNHAHSGADQTLAESAAIHTYMLLADLVRHTDMQPIIKYEG